MCFHYGNMYITEKLTILTISVSFLRIICVIFGTVSITVESTFSLKIIGSYHSKKKKMGAGIIGSFKLSI